MAESPSKRLAPNFQVELKRSPRKYPVESAEGLKSEENYQESLVVISDARSAASSAQVAARLCVETINASKEVRKITTEYMDSAAMKARRKRVWWNRLGSSDVDKFRDISQNCRDALHVLMEMIVRAARASNEALRAARVATRHADLLDETSNRQLEYALTSHESVKAFAEKANSKAKIADTERYLLLRAMYECMEEADFVTTPMENFRSVTFGNRMVRYVPPIAIFAVLSAVSTLLFISLDAGLSTDTSLLKTSIGIGTALSGSKIMTYLLHRGYIYLKKCECTWREEKRKKIMQEVITVETHLQRMGISIPSMKDVKDEILKPPSNEPQTSE